MPGLPRDIIKKYGVSKRAWEVFRSRSSFRRKTKLPRAKIRYVSPRRSRRLASRFYPRLRRRNHRSRKIPILPMLGLIPPMANLATWVKDPLQQGNLQGAAYNGAYSLLKDFTGFDLNQGRWTGGNLLQTYSGILAGYLGHMLASRIGVNRYMSRIPIVGKWVEF